jgi:hypothetical protein
VASDNNRKAVMINNVGIILDTLILCRIYFPGHWITNSTRNGKASNFCFFRYGNVLREAETARMEHVNFFNIEKISFYFYHWRQHVNIKAMR